MTIQQNIQAVLDHLGIKGVVIIEEKLDRVNATDSLGELRRHIRVHPEHWSRDVKDFMHGHIAASYRERTRPSMQVCLHPISQINPNHPPEQYYDEIDIDFSPPDSPINFLRHSLEVGHNLVMRHTTDEEEAGRLLAERFQRESETQNA